MENYLFAPPEGESHVKPTLVLIKHEPWTEVVTKPSATEGDKERKDRKEEGKKEEKGNNQQEGMGLKYNDRRMDEDGPLVGLSTNADYTGTLSVSAASTTLLSLNASKCMTGEGRVVGKAFDTVDNRRNSHEAVQHEV